MAPWCYLVRQPTVISFLQSLQLRALVTLWYFFLRDPRDWSDVGWEVYREGNGCEDCCHRGNVSSGSLLLAAHRGSTAAACWDLARGTSI